MKVRQLPTSLARPEFREREFKDGQAAARHRIFRDPYGQPFFEFNSTYRSWFSNDPF